jgi:hypothetical protein
MTAVRTGSNFVSGPSGSSNENRRSMTASAIFIFATAKPFPRHLYRVSLPTEKSQDDASHLRTVEKSEEVAVTRDLLRTSGQTFDPTLRPELMRIASPKFT